LYRFEFLENLSETQYIVKFYSTTEIEINLVSLNDALILMDFIEQRYATPLNIISEDQIHNISVNGLFPSTHSVNIVQNRHITLIKNNELRIHSEPLKSVTRWILTFGALIAWLGAGFLCYAVLVDLVGISWLHLSFSMFTGLLLWGLRIITGRTYLTIKAKHLIVKRQGLRTKELLLPDIWGCINITRTTKILTRRGAITVGRNLTAEHCRTVQAWLAPSIKELKK